MRRQRVHRTPETMRCGCWSSPVQSDAQRGGKLRKQSHGAIAPGEIVALYGTGMGPARWCSHAQLQRRAGHEPRGHKCILQRAAAPVLYTSSNQVAAIVPYGLTGKSRADPGAVSGQVSAPVSVDVAASAPGLFTLSGTAPGGARDQPGRLDQRCGPSSGSEQFH
jgi:uncharacterized protein (TIGR03437 family)